MKKAVIGHSSIWKHQWLICVCFFVYYCYNWYYIADFNKVRYSRKFQINVFSVHLLYLFKVVAGFCSCFRKRIGCNMPPQYILQYKDERLLVKFSWFSYFRTVQIWPHWQFLLRSCSFICTATCARSMRKFNSSHNIPPHVGAWPHTVDCSSCRILITLWSVCEWYIRQG